MRAPYQSRRLGIGLIIAAPFAGVLAFMVVYRINPVFATERNVMTVIFACSVMMIIIGKRVGAKSTLHALSTDRRAPVVYLRSFSDDGKQINLRGVVHNGEEESLAGVLHAIGPVIAIGKPGEFLPETGAHRLYVSDEHWMRVAGTMIQEARLILFRAGLSEGILWELERLRKVPDPTRLLLFVPFQPKKGFFGVGRDDRYAQFRLAAHQYLGVWLPENPQGKRFFRFAADWTAAPVDGENLWWTWNPYEWNWIERASLRRELSSLLASPPPDRAALAEDSELLAVIEEFQIH